MFAFLRTILHRLRSIMLSLWRSVRQLSGDDAYERYLNHFTQHHADAGAQPLSRAAFFKQWQDRKWKGIKRCC